MRQCIKQNAVKTWVGLFTVLGLSGCAYANPAAEDATTAVKPHKQVLLMNTKEGQTVTWDSSMPVSELEHALTALPAEKAAQVRQLLQQVEQGELNTGDGVVRLQVADSGEVKMLADKIVVKSSKPVRLNAFSDVRQAISEGQFSKTQLQELQKLIDSKF